MCEWDYPPARPRPIEQRKTLFRTVYPCKSAAVAA